MHTKTHPITMAVCVPYWINTHETRCKTPSAPLTHTFLVNLIGDELLASKRFLFVRRCNWTLFLEFSQHLNEISLGHYRLQSNTRSKALTVPPTSRQVVRMGRWIKQKQQTIVFMLMAFHVPTQADEHPGKRLKTQNMNSGTIWCKSLAKMFDYALWPP